MESKLTQITLSIGQALFLMSNSCPKLPPAYQPKDGIRDYMQANIDFHCYEARYFFKLLLRFGYNLSLMDGTSLELKTLDFYSVFIPKEQSCCFKCILALHIMSLPCHNTHFFCFTGRTESASLQCCIMSYNQDFIESLKMGFSSWSQSISIFCRSCQLQS